jgi:multidrug resistance efflux pump
MPERDPKKSTPPEPASTSSSRRSRRCKRAWTDATLTSPIAGLVTEKLVEVGEVIAPRTPALVVVDLDHAWADVFVPEPTVPQIRIGSRRRS